MILILLFISFNILPSHSKNSFVVDYENDRFLKDGQPFRYIAGALHYFQVPHDLWRDRMERARAMGVNAIQTIVKWNTHEMYQGRYKFDGDGNIIEFLSIAKNLSLLVILRVGPYIDAEQDFGGYPYWLLKYPNISVRSSVDARFRDAALKWFSVLLPQIRPMLYINGGPVVMVQTENEYGSYGCDKNYTLWLKEAAQKYLVDEVVYYSTDTPNLDSLQCGQVPGTLTTVDFGVHNESEVATAFNNLRRVMPKGPKVNSEFYPGWYDSWGYRKSPGQPSTAIRDTMKYMWHQNASFTIYLVHGGTNWGYQASSEYPPFRSTTTEYDFNAPISEAGDITQKYLDMKSTIEELTGEKVKYPLPTNSTKFGYGKVMVQYLGNVFDLVYSLTPLETIQQSTYPLTMEQLDQPSGFVLYETSLKTSGGYIDLGQVHDRAYVIIDFQLIKVIQRGSTKSIVRLPKTTNAGSVLHILVENQGHIAYGSSIGATDQKGLVSNVTLDNNIITNWTMYPLKLENLYGSNSKIPLKKYFMKHQKRVKSVRQYIPSFYLGYFMVDSVGDTFLNTTGWGKGQLIVNGNNLGRYWPTKGPQLSLYVPSVYLSGFNQIILFELDQPGNCEDKFMCYVNFVDYPLYSN